MPRIRILTAALVGCLLLLPAVAQAEETVSIKAAFSPNKLGAPTLVNGSSVFTSTTSRVPSPLSKVSIIGPAGMGLNLKGSSTCNAALLLNNGPKACNARSVAGSGGGMGIFELAGEIIEEPFTLNLFVGSNRPGHVELLIYVNAVSPVSVQLVFHAPVVNEPKPYGLGFSFVVPPIATLPGASNASVKSAHITIGATAAEQKRYHIKGILVPKRCPTKGFPIQTQFGFEDGSTVISKSAIRCPAKAKKHH